MVLVLWFILLIFVIAVSLSYTLTIGVQMTSHGRKALKASGLARAAIGKAVIDLKNDRLMAAADPNYNIDTLADVWALTEDKTDIEYGDGIYTVRIIDDNRKLDLNTISPINRVALEYLLTEYCDVDTDVAVEMVNALIDYIDADSVSQADPTIEESEYYTEFVLDEFGDLYGEGYYFLPRNEPLLSEHELINIPGFTHEVLFGYAEDTPDDLIERIDSEEVSYALIDYVTVNSGGTVNINTAPRPLIEAMLAAASGNLGDERNWAGNIIDLREDLMEQPDAGARGIMDMSQLPMSGLPETVLNNLTSMFQLRPTSRFFTIVARGEVDGIRETRSLRVYVELQRYPLDDEFEYGRGRRDIVPFGVLRSQESFKIDPEVRVDRLHEL